MIADIHLAHGLAGDETLPDWPPLTENEVDALLARVPTAGLPQDIRWRSSRPMSAAALVGTTHGGVFVKRHHASLRNVGTLAEEHRFATHLRARGVPVPALHLDLDGRTAIALGEWIYEVQTPARGQDLYRDAFSWSPAGCRRHAQAAGAMLARLHLAAGDYQAPQRGTHIIVARAEIFAAKDPVDVLEKQLPTRPALARYLRERDWRVQLRETIAPWHAAAFCGIARQPRLWTHGDWHVSNLCWSHAGDRATITDVLDFGLSAATFALFDLATAIERNAIAWLDKADADIGRKDLALALVEGYHAVRPLSADDRVVLADLLPLVHVDFALSEIEYFEGITGRREHADVAWHTFLHGHTAWFATPPGRALLAALRQADGAFVL